MTRNFAALAFDKESAIPYISGMSFRSRRSALRSALIAILLLTALRLDAQVLPFEVLGLKDGIPQSQITALAQDAEGYVWVGTWGGLARFNGREFKSFFEEGLPSSRIQKLLAARDGTLWVATGGGLSLYRDHRLEPHRDPAVGKVRCRALAEDRSGRIWVGTDDGVAVLSGDALTLIHPGGGAHGPLVQDVLASGDLIRLVADNGLWRISVGGRPEAEPGPPGVAPDGYRALAATPEGLWLGTYNDGVWLRDAWGWHPAPAGTEAARCVYQMTVERSGTLYIATNGEGLFLKRPDRSLAEHWGTANGLPSSVINASLEDREGNLWVGTYIGGLARLSGLAVINHTEKQGLPSACVFGISPGDTPDSLWLGTLHGAVHYQVRPVPRVIEALRLRDGLSNEWVWKALRDPAGTLWLLTDTALYYRLPGEKRVRELAPDVPIPRTVPWDMALDRQGNVWVCGEGSRGGLARRDTAGRWASWDKGPAGESLTDVSHVVPRPKGGVWLTAKNRFYTCDGRTLGALEAPCPPALGNSISTILEDSRGRLWAGSDTGLAVLDASGTWRLLNDLPGFTNHHVFFIGEDLHGILWINTARGVFRIGDDFQVESFTPDDGLADWETNANGFYCGARGEIWIGTVGGLSQYDPSGRSLNAAPPSLVVESVKLPGRVLDHPRALDLAWKERSPVFSVAVLSFRNRGRAAYRARLEGMEKDWLPVRSPGELRYTNLPPGNLSLLLQPVNDSGVWGETIALPLRVRPPFWMTLGFRLSAGFLLLAAATVVFRWRTLVLRRRNRELQQEVSRRTAELQYLATYDPLTGLLNRRAILARLDGELNPQRAGHRRLGCIMIDLDRFKSVNDTLGHAAGDGVLKDMAARIKACLRQGDDLGRLGGDEFLVVAPGADSEALRAVNRRIAGLECRVGEGAGPGVVTASCGAVLVKAGSPVAPAAVLARADDLLYGTKRAGRRDFPVEEL